MRLLILGIILWLMAIVAFSDTIVNPASQPVNMRVVGAMAAATPTGTPAAPTPTPTPAGFDPSTIAGLTGWWKADAITSPGLARRPRPGQQPIVDGEAPMPKDGIEPLAIVDGDPVNNWIDSSVNAYSMTVDVGSPPVYKTNILNGKPVVRFIATTGTLNASANPLAGTTGYTIFAVASWGNVSGTKSLFATGNGTGPTIIIRGDTTTLAGYHNSGAWFSATEPGGITLNTANQITFNWDGANVHLWRNGLLKATTAVTTITNPVAATSVGQEYSAGNYFYGDIAEILIYNTALSTTDRQNVENYLKAKYGL